MLSIPYSRYIVYPVTWYSFLIVLGAALAILLAVKEEKRAGLPKDTVIDLALWVLPIGIIGARVYYVVFSWDQFRNDPLSVFRIWEGGIAIYGAVIAGVIVVVLFCRNRKIPAMKVLDLLVPGLALAQAIGRWGNYFNMEAYGPQVTDPALCFFPLAVQIPAGDGMQWHLATFFYESVWDLGVFVFLIICRRGRFREQGDAFRFYLLLYSAGRQIIEELRTDSLYAGSSVRVSQLLSAILCLYVLIHIYRCACVHGGMRPVIRAALFIPAMLFSIAALCCAASPALLSGLATGNRILLYSACSLAVILCSMILFFSTDHPEGCHADNSL